MNITHLANVSYSPSYAQSYSASYSRDEVFTFTAQTTDRPDYQPVTLQKVIVENKYTYEVPADITINIGDEVICEAANNRMWIGKVTALESNFVGNCKKIKMNVSDWSFNKKLLFRLREDLRQEIAYLQTTSEDVYEDVMAYFDGMKNKILNYRIDEEVKHHMIKYLSNFITKIFALKEAA